MIQRLKISNNILPQLFSGLEIACLLRRWRPAPRQTQHQLRRPNNRDSTGKARGHIVELRSQDLWVVNGNGRRKSFERTDGKKLNKADLYTIV